MHSRFYVHVPSFLLPYSPVNADIIRVRVGDCVLDGGLIDRASGGEGAREVLENVVRLEGLLSKLGVYVGWKSR